ncbi:hypothetical protein MTO96_005635 [Rhipicephalus appendiculatus]
MVATAFALVNRLPCKTQLYRSILPPLLHHRPSRVSASAAVRLITGANCPGCPARRRTCNSCGKQGHFSKMCRSSGDSPTVADGEVGQERTVTNTVTVPSVQGAVNGIQLMRVPVRINGIQIHMLVDTGAVVSLLNMQDYLNIFRGSRLLNSHFTIHNHSEQVIGNLGFFHATVQYHGKSASVKIFVTETGTSLLGLDAVHALQMLNRLSAPDPSRVQEPGHRRVHRPGLSTVATKFHRHPFRLAKDVTDDLARLEEAGVLKRMGKKIRVSGKVPKGFSFDKSFEDFVNQEEQTTGMHYSVVDDNYMRCTINKAKVRQHLDAHRRSGNVSDSSDGETEPDANEETTTLHVYIEERTGDALSDLALGTAKAAARAATQTAAAAAANAASEAAHQIAQGIAPAISAAVLETIGAAVVQAAAQSAASAVTPPGASSSAAGSSSSCKRCLQQCARPSPGDCCSCSGRRSRPRAGERCGSASSVGHGKCRGGGGDVIGDN